MLGSFSRNHPRSCVIISFGLRLLAEDATWRLINVFQSAITGAPGYLHTCCLLNWGIATPAYLLLIRLCDWGIVLPRHFRVLVPWRLRASNRPCRELCSAQVLLGLLPAQREQLPRGLITFEAGPIPVSCGCPSASMISI